ncbi:MAG TPA: phasin family protein [Allosphingosinicella sp.]|nr:phasin family protein [Allosphingosinicella sp.]
MADQNHDTKTAPASKPSEAAHSAPASASAHVAKAADKSADAPKAAAAPAKAEAHKAAAPAAKADTPKKAAPARRAAAAKAAKPARKAARTFAKAAPAAAASATRAAKAAVRTSTDTINEGTRTMKNETNKVADRVQAVFGDANARAKTAFERNTRFAEEMTDFTKGNVAAIVASTKVAAKGVETIGQEVAELSRRSFEEASASIRNFAEIKSPTDFFRLQTEFARGQFDTLVAEGAKLSEAMIKMAGDVAQPLTSRYSVAAEKVKTVVSA